jgi:hypothetical protein
MRRAGLHEVNFEELAYVRAALAHGAVRDSTEGLFSLSQRWLGGISRRARSRDQIRPGGSAVKLKSFTGYRGQAALMQIGNIKYLVLAQNKKHLEALHAHILPKSAEPFNPFACQASVIISSKTLPEPTTKNEPSHTTPESPKA